MKQPIKMTPGDELHLTALMAPFSLNLCTGHDRQHLLGYGRAAFEAGQKTTAAGQCLHQIQEPAPAQAAPAAVAVPDECAAFEAKFRHLDLSQKPDAWGHARYSHDAISLAWEAWQARAALAATPAAPVAEDVRHRNGVRKLQAASASQARKDGVDAGDALYALAVKHGASKTEAAGFAHHINGAFALLEGQVHDGLSRETARDSATPTAAAPVVLPAGRLSGAEMIEALEWRRQAELEAISASPAAAAPVVLPEPDAVISEVMGLVDEWGMESHLRGEAELDAQHSEATQEEIDCAKDRATKERAAWKAIESKLRAMLAGVSAPAAQEGVADEVNCVCGASWLRHGANDYEMTDTPRQARADARDAGVQWWLADIDQYGNPTLTDGAHSDRSGADKAAYLINAMGLGQGRKFAVARVELSDPKPSAEGVNHEAIAQNNRAAQAAAKEGAQG